MWLETAALVSAIRELTLVCVQIHRDTDTLLCSHVADRSVVYMVSFPISPVFCVHPTHTQEPPKFPHSLHTPQEPCHSLWGTFSLFPSCTWRSVHSGPIFLIDTSNETKTFKGGRMYFRFHSCKKLNSRKAWIVAKNLDFESSELNANLPSAPTAWLRRVSKLNAFAESCFSAFGSKETSHSRHPAEMVTCLCLFQVRTFLWNVLPALPATHPLAKRRFV